LTRKGPLTAGREIYYHGAATRGVHLHLMGSMGLGLHNAAQSNLYTWYAALLVTY
jgi:hypothetical protein